jgi:hypothetical protein
VENQILDFRDTIRKPVELIRAQEALRAQFAGAIAAEQARFDRERAKHASVPAPRRQRKRSLASTLKAARKAGANHATVDGVVIALAPAAAVPEAVNNGHENEWDAVLPGGDHGPH